MNEIESYEFFVIAGNSINQIIKNQLAGYSLSQNMYVFFRLQYEKIMIG